MAAVSAELALLADDARSYIDSAKAAATVRGYRSDWRQFSSWCDERGLEALPAAPETVALYLTAHAGVRATATLQRHLTSISQAHQAVGHETPTTAPIVRQTWRGIRRTFGTASVGKAPARTAEIRSMVSTLDDRPISVRDRALLLVGFAGAFRRSELVALDVDDLAHTADGMVVTIRRSKTDQEGAGEQIGIPYGSDPATCPVRACRAWLELAGMDDGPVFRPVSRHDVIASRRLGDRAVAEVVKRCAAAAGLDPRQFAGHSLRAGLITSAAEAGVAERDIMRQSRHKSVPVMRRYIRGATVWQANAAAAVGL
jgi:site-specific recombinase XerD